MRKGDAGPAGPDGFADRRARARVVNISAEIRAVIDAAQHPIRVRHQMEQAEPNAIRRCAVDGKTFRAPRLDAHTFVPGHSVTHARLRRSGGDDGSFAKILRSL